MSGVLYFVFHGIIVAALLLPVTCLHRSDKSHMEHGSRPTAEKERPVSEEVTPAPDSTASFSVVSESARKALIVSCGRCHQSTLDSHKPGAIAVFDLDLGEQWHATLNAEQLTGMDRRAKGNTTLNKEQRRMIAEFVARKEALLQ